MRQFIAIITLVLALLASFSLSASAQFVQTSDCSNQHMLCSQIGFGDGQGVSTSILLTQQVTFHDPIANELMMTPIGQQTFLEGFNKNDPTNFVTTAETSDDLANEITVTQATRPFEVFSYEGLSSITGGASPAELVFLNADGQLYVVFAINVPHLDLVSYVNNIIDGGDFTDGPLGFTPINSL